MRAKLPVGLEADIESAEREALQPDVIPDLLARHRAGDPEARQSLLSGLRHLCYEVALRPAHFRADRLGTLWQALQTAVDRLTANRVTNAVKHVRDELNRAMRDANAEESANIIAPSSTNYSRRQAGQPEYQAVKKVASIDAHHKARPGESTYDPVDNSQPGDMAEMLDTFCRTAEDEEVARMLVDGYDYRTVAATLSITKARVESIVIAFRRRAEQAGLTWPEREAA